MFCFSFDSNHYPHSTSYSPEYKFFIYGHNMFSYSICIVLHVCIVCSRLLNKYTYKLRVSNWANTICLNCWCNNTFLHLGVIKNDRHFTFDIQFTKVIENKLFMNGLAGVLWKAIEVLQVFGPIQTFYNTHFSCSSVIVIYVLCCEMIGLPEFVVSFDCRLSSSIIFVSFLLYTI